MPPAGPGFRTRTQRCADRPDSLGGQDEAAHRAVKADQLGPLVADPHHCIPASRSIVTRYATVQGRRRGADAAHRGRRRRERAFDRPGCDIGSQYAAVPAFTLATSQAAALALPTVGEWVFVVYASSGSATESQVIGVASSAARAEELAERYAEEDGYAWRGPDWLAWDSARRVRPAVDGAGPPSRYGWWRSPSMSSATSRSSRSRSSTSTTRVALVSMTAGTDDRRRVKPGHRVAHPAGRSPSCRA